MAEDPLDDLRKLSGAGGTPGGTGEFLAGFCMAVAGGWRGLGLIARGLRAH